MQRPVLCNTQSLFRLCSLQRKYIHSESQSHRQTEHELYGKSLDEIRKQIVSPQVQSKQSKDIQLSETKETSLEKWNLLRKSSVDLPGC